LRQRRLRQRVLGTSFRTRRKLLHQTDLLGGHLIGPQAEGIGSADGPVRQPHDQTWVGKRASTRGFFGTGIDLRSAHLQGWGVSKRPL
jgi:hypothetical protein